jgi:NADH:ubiquinone oxidoreductase subunit E
MEILGVEKLRSTIIQPLGASQRLTFWAVPISARVITDALVVTPITVLDVSTKRRGSTQLNGAHDATLCRA